MVRFLKTNAKVISRNKKRPKQNLTLGHEFAVLDVLPPEAVDGPTEVEPDRVGPAVVEPEKRDNLQKCCFRVLTKIIDAQELLSNFNVIPSFCEPELKLINTRPHHDEPDLQKFNLRV